MDFVVITTASLVMLLAACCLERSGTGSALSEAMADLTRRARADTERLLRAVLGGFFVSLWVKGDVLLTPELKTSLGFVPWLQLGIAVSMLWRPTLLLGAIGIVVLYGCAVRSYGVFHLLDYPIFLGVAAYLGLTALRLRVFGLAPLDVLRWLTAITLMWASVEKWAYPHWTFPLLVLHPNLALGFDPVRYMTLAGMVEFALAFALVWTPLIRRSAAIVLCAIFIGAVPEFGKLDAIGHAPIIAALAAFAAAESCPTPRRVPLLAPALLCAALVLFVSAYYGAHVALFGGVLA